MSSFHDVKESTCLILKDDGKSVSGTGFFVLPEGYLITCHHVIFGLNSLKVKISSSAKIYNAEYLEEYSNVKLDIAILKISAESVPSVQLGRIRRNSDAIGFGFRPSTIELEPKGHAYTGQIKEGQNLKFPISREVISHIQSIPPDERKLWNKIPPGDEFRTGNVYNFNEAWGLEQGISGGPIYDSQLRKVVGLFRAIEGANAYITPIDSVFECWAELESTNQNSVKDTQLDNLERYFGISLLQDGAKPIRSLSSRYFESLLTGHKYFTGRKNELELLVRFIEENKERYFFVTGPSGFGKTALLSRLVKQLQGKEIQTIFHFITPQVPKGLEYDFFFSNLCQQLLEFHNLGGVLPSTEDLPLLYVDLLRFAPAKEKRLVIIIDGLDETIGRWEKARELSANVFPKNIPENVQIIFSARSIADKDWLNDLQLQLGKGLIVSLDKLDISEIQETISQLEFLPKDSTSVKNVTRRLFTLSEGDPFYFNDLLIDLEKQNWDIEQFSKFPVKHSNYLKEWWQSAFTNDQGFIDLMGTLTVALAPLGRRELINISKNDSLRGATIDALLDRVSRYLSGNEEEGYLISHRRISDFIKDKLEDEIEIYHSRIASFCIDWRNAPKGKPLNYILSYGIMHILEQDQKQFQQGKPKVLEYCLQEEGAFLIEAIKTNGIQNVEKQLKGVFVFYFEKKLWLEVGRLLPFFKLFAYAKTSINSILQIIGQQRLQDPIESYLPLLESISNERLQRAFCLILLIQLYKNKYNEKANALIHWLIQNHRGKFVPGPKTIETVILNSLLFGEASELAEILVTNSLFTDKEIEFDVFVFLLRENQNSRRREFILTRLHDSLSVPDSISIRTLENILSQSIEENDFELCLAAMKLIGKSSDEANVEQYRLGKLLSTPIDNISKLVIELCNNPRVKKYDTIRAAVCAGILLGPAWCEQTYFEKLLHKLVQVAHVSVSKIIKAMMQYCALAFSIWEMDLTQFQLWTSSRISLITNTIRTQNIQFLDNESALNSVRKFVNYYCTSIRWVISQCGKSQIDEAKVVICLTEISTLAWLDSKFCNVPLVKINGDGKLDFVLDKNLDPLNAYTLADTVDWLQVHIGLQVEKNDYLYEVNKTATSELVTLIFGNENNEIADSLLTALAHPALLDNKRPEGSPWLELLQSISSSIGISWKPNWSQKLRDNFGNEYIFPDKLLSTFKFIRKRIIELTKDFGLFPQMLKLSVNLSIALGEELNKEEFYYLLGPATNYLDPQIISGIPNYTTWPPDIIPLLLARRVPSAFAETLGSLEVCERGLLWKASMDMCRDIQNKDWWDSVKRFRSRLLSIVDGNPHISVKSRTSEEDNEKMEVLNHALAPINLIIDNPPLKKDFDVLVGEVNFNIDSSMVRLKKVVEHHPHPMILKWCVEEFWDSREKRALWLVEALINADQWELLVILLNGFYGKIKNQEVDWLDGFQDRLRFFDISSEEKINLNYYSELERALGIGPEEGFIYRIDELVHKYYLGELNQVKQIIDYRQKIQFLPDWKDVVENLFYEVENGRGRREIVLCLLFVALLSEKKAPALLAERLVESSDKDFQTSLETNLLWIGKVVAPSLLKSDRIFDVAEASGDLNVLAFLQNSEAIRRHLIGSTAKNTSGYSSQLQWYHKCGGIDSFSSQKVVMEPKAQQQCLEIYVELAPGLLNIDNKNVNTFSISDLEDLKPPSNVSTSLKYLEYKLSRPIANAAAQDNLKLATTWMKAILIEANLGPKRQNDLNCIECICRCAGSWLSIENNLAFRNSWIEYVKEKSEEFNTISVWNSFLGGLGNSYKDKFSSELKNWIIDDYIAQIALAEELTSHGRSSDARNFWIKLTNKHRSPWIAIRACRSFLSSEGSRNLGFAKEFAHISWQKVINSDKAKDLEILAKLIDCAISTKSENLVLEIFNYVHEDEVKTVSLGRIAIDVFNRQISDYSWSTNDTGSWDQAPWTLPEIIKTDGFSNFVLSLAGESIFLDNRELGKFNHPWRNPNIKSGLNWLTSLLKLVLNPTWEQFHSLEGTSYFEKKEYRLNNDLEQAILLSWIDSWIGKIDPEKDENWKVCKVISSALKNQPSIIRNSNQAIFDFIISSLENPQGRFSKLVDLVLNFLVVDSMKLDCLRILDTNISQIESKYNIDQQLSKIAIECETIFPNMGVSQIYIDKISMDHLRFLVEDTISENKKLTYDFRLRNLINAPKIPEIDHRLAEICLQKLDSISSSDDNSIKLLSKGISRLLPSNDKFYKDFARFIADKLDFSELEAIQKEAKRSEKIYTEL